MNSAGRFPSEDEQNAAYTHLLDLRPEGTITIGTLDIGGDKVLPYFSLGPLDNPFLGLRGNRVFRYHPEVFSAQINAILRVGMRAKSLRVLLPMVESVDDLLFLSYLIEFSIRDLPSERKQFSQDFQRGALI